MTSQGEMIDSKDALHWPRFPSKHEMPDPNFLYSDIANPIFSFSATQMNRRPEFRKTMTRNHDSGFILNLNHKPNKAIRSPDIMSAKQSPNITIKNVNGNVSINVLTSIARGANLNSS